MATIQHDIIGIIHSPFSEPKGTPIQPPAAQGITGTVEIFPPFVEGLADVERFSHLILLYQFHLVTTTSLTVKPFLDTVTHSVFATRASGRPNRIGLSFVTLLGQRGNILDICDVDIVEGTPLIDIKPFVPAFDTRENCRTGWMEDNFHKLPSMKDDGRFLDTQI